MMASSSIPASLETAMALAGQLFRQGKARDAETAMRQAASVWPSAASPCLGLGELYRQTGRQKEALDAFLQAVGREPGNAPAHFHAGGLLIEAGRLDDAVAILRRCIEIDAGAPNAHLMLGNALLRQRRLDEAALAYGAALALKPDWPPALVNLGLVLREQGRLDDALLCQRKVLAAQPDNTDALANLGGLLRRLGRLNEAEEAYRHALALVPNQAAAVANMAMILDDQGKTGEAAQYYQLALALAPDDAAIRFNHAMFLLKTGDFAAGWTEYEWRWQARKATLKPRVFSQPLWAGEDLDGRTLLVHAEQGFGDSVQFVRFAVRIARAGRGRVILAVQAPLVDLFETALRGIARVQELNAPLPPFDVQVPLMSLPRVLGVSLDDVAGMEPYLTASPALVEAWRPRIDARGAALTVGLTWNGSRDRGGRAMDAATLWQHLAQFGTGVRFFSLQTDLRPHDRTLLAATNGGMTDLGSDLRSFGDTAAVLSHLDLLISIDTAVVHVAGALGRPVWIMVPFAPDWRWMLEREDNPWYPSARLFRQTRPGDWDDVLGRVVTALETRLDTER